MRDLAERLGRRSTDLVLVALALASLAEAIATTAPVNRGVMAPLLPLAPLALLLRRRFPLPAPTLAMLLLAVAAALDGTGVNGLTSPFLVGLATAAAFGAIAERREALAGLAVMLIAIEFIQSRFPHEHVGDYIVDSLLFGGRG